MLICLHMGRLLKSACIYNCRVRERERERGRVTVCGYGGHEREGGQALMLMSLL